MRQGEKEQPLNRWDLLLLGAFALLKVAIHLCTTGLGPYGYFRDEFYYFDCASHLAWGYVDQPPLSLLILAITRGLLGDSILAIRLPVILAGAATVVIAGLIARGMGGGRFAQALACLTVIVAPVYLTMSSFFSVNAFDELFWAVSAYLIVHIIRTGNPHLWLWFGLVAGLGLENKIGMGFFGGCLAVALLLTPQRKYYLDKHLWLGGLVAAVLFVPHVLWQIKHGWPTLEFMRNVSEYKNVPVTLPKFFLGQLLFMNPLSAPIWIAGILYGLFSSKGRNFRLFSLIYIGLFAVFFWGNGKSYYLTPVYPPLLALGAVWMEQATLARPRVRWTVVGLLGTSGVLLAPHAIPILPPEALIRYQNVIGLKAPQQERAHAGVLPEHLGDRLGWNEMLAFLGDAYKRLDATDRTRCALFVSNYGEAGAVNHFGAKYGLPKAISGYMNYYLWGPGDATGEMMLFYWNDRTTLEQLFEQVTEVARFTHPYVMERQNNRPLYLCRKLKVPMAEAWPRLKMFK